MFTVFIALDIVTYLKIGRLLLEADTKPKQLPIRYPYIGLDEMYSSTNIKTSKFDPLINAPILATQVSRVEPNKVFPVDIHQWLSDFGTLSPPDRNLHVTNTVSHIVIVLGSITHYQQPEQIHTIAQFHILDWGMEKCALTVRLPQRDAVLPHEYEVKDVRGIVRLDICELDMQRPLNALDLTWKKRPKCIKRAEAINARVGEEVQLEPFPCQTGTFKAFEVSCAPDMPDCGVNVWSNHNDTWGTYYLIFGSCTILIFLSAGFYITQYQTV